MSEPQILSMEQVDELERGAASGQYLHKMSALDLIATIRSLYRNNRQLDGQLQDAWESKRIMAGQWLDHEATIRRLDDKIHRLRAELDARRATDGLSVIE